MAVTTLYGHCSKALAFFNNTNIYFGLGKQTDWSNPDIPDPPNVNQKEVIEPLGFKKCESKYLVIPDPEGSIIYRDTRWTITPANQIYTQGAKWVYVECYINYGELPLDKYGQVGLLLDLVRAAGVDDAKAALLPEEVSSQGTLFLIDNRKLTTRQKDQKEKLSFIIEF
jgi:hypothetical protein